jgi:hypothetical protein
MNEEQLHRFLKWISDRAHEVKIVGGAAALVYKDGEFMCIPITPDMYDVWCVDESPLGKFLS